MDNLENPNLNLNNQEKISDTPVTMPVSDDFNPEGYSTAKERERVAMQPTAGDPSNEPNRKPLYITIIVFLVLVLFIMSIIFLGRKIDRENPGLAGLIDDYQLSVGDYEQANQYENKDIIESEDDPSIGPDNPLMVIVEFGDFACSNCRQIYSMMRQISVRYSDKVKIIWRDFPVTSEDDLSTFLAEAGECADDQGKFWIIHDQFFSLQDQLSREKVYEIAEAVSMDMETYRDCLETGQHSSEVIEDSRVAYEELGLKGTPTLFINGTKIEGAIPQEEFMRFLNDYFELYDELSKTNN